MKTSRFVDEYAVVKAQIEALTKKADELKAKLLATGETELEGKVFAAKISIFEQTRLDMPTVRSFLTEEQIALATRCKTAVRINIKAKVGKSLAA